MDQIPVDLIDVNFQDDPHFSGGALPDLAGERNQFPKASQLFGADGPLTLIPREMWMEETEDNLDLADTIDYIMNQGQEGSCVYNAGASAWEICFFIATGCRMRMSPISGYALNSRSPGSGSTVPGCLRHIRDVGLLPLDTEFNRQVLRAAGLDDRMVLPATGWRNARNFLRANDGTWQQVAKWFRFKEIWDVSSVTEMMSCYFRDFPVVYARAGHCICGVNCVRDSGYYSKYRNSWSASWGDSGYGYDSERYVIRSGAAYGAFAVRNAVIPGWLLKKEVFELFQEQGLYA